jgi:ribosomal protein L24E
MSTDGVAPFSEGLADLHTNFKIISGKYHDHVKYRITTTTANMRTYEDTFSGQKIYPGKVRHQRSLCPPEWNTRAGVIVEGIIDNEQQGKLYIRGDSKIFRFQNGKTESLFLQRKNPRRIAWTVLFRRQHRKGISEVSERCGKLGCAFKGIKCTIEVIRVISVVTLLWRSSLGHTMNLVLLNYISVLTTSPQTGSSQEALPSYRQAPACHRRCFPRCHQRAPLHAPRGSRRSTSISNQGGQGEEGCRREQEEGRQGQVSSRRRQGTDITYPEQARIEGRSDSCGTKHPLDQWEDGAL